MTNVLNHEELSVWLSTTMIQALRNMITLFTHYFDALEYMLDRFLELLALCICQENDTISRIGSNCLQQLILKNVTKFKPQHWNKLVGAFCELFERTTAYQLFTATAINSTASIEPPPNGLDFSSTPQTDVPVDEKSLKINGSEEADDDSIAPPLSPRQAEEDLRTPTAESPQAPLEEFKPSSNLQQQPIVVTAARRRFFNRIISRCVLQLLMIETVNELFSNDTVYTHIPSTELLRLMALLKRSFQFARRFNEDKELRMRLWREGFSEAAPQPPEAGERRLESRPDVEAALVPLCKDIVHSYSTLEDESQHRNIIAWRPVVVDVLEGFATFPEDAFKTHIPDFYPLAINLLIKDLTPDLRAALLVVLRRVGEVGLGIEGMSRPGDGRRDSVVSRTTEGTIADHEADARRML
ncbi:guanine nucleotide exchange protein for ADP-robosylation factor [Fusarium falciforme]|nr:guanine nucleotide exchange protein for ADP-robosylation factor [Fusarium falciforme]